MEYEIQVPLGYFQLIKQEQLNTVDLLLLCYLEWLCSIDGGHTKVKNQQIYEDTGLTEKQVRVALQKLEKMSFITRKMAYIPNSDCMVVRYIEVNTDYIAKTIVKIRENSPEV